MTDVLRFILIGISTGALYSFVSQGLVLIYNGSGLVNFAQGGFVLVGAYTFYESQQRGWPAPVGFAAAVTAGAVVGALMQVLILGPMRNASPLARVIATLGLLLVLQSAAVLVYGVEVKSVRSTLPTSSVRLPGDINIGADRLWMIAVAVVLTIGLRIVYGTTSFGRATKAVAENQIAAASLGHSPDMIATINWAAGAALAAAGGTLLAPITFLQPTQLVLLVIPALAAGLIAGFSSFTAALLGCFAVGISESLASRYISAPGWSGSIAFLIVIAVLVVRGRALPLRSHVLDRLPMVGSGRVRPVPVAITAGVLAVLITFALPTNWVDASTILMIFAILCLSVVVVTGYGGQLSLAQFVLAGVGALVAARLYSSLDLPFVVALLGGMVVTGATGTIVAIPALRSRGINLAIATLGMAVFLFNVVLSNRDWTGGDLGIDVRNPEIFGWDISSIRHANRYGLVTLAALIVLMLMVANVRRGAAGRRLLAVRSNERAAASLGVSVFGAKLYAFALGAVIAAVGGVLYAFRNSIVLANQFGVLPSINLVGVTVVGGVGMLGGAVFGAFLQPGGIVSEALRSIRSLDSYLPLVGGIFLLLMLRNHQNGMYLMHVDLAKAALGKVTRRRGRQAGSPGPDIGASANGSADDATETRHIALADRSPRRDRLRDPLIVRELGVRFGGVVAVDHVSLEVAPGTVHGLIGPNGAGKTTFIDGVTGFVRTSSGEAYLGGRRLTTRSPQARFRAGLGRSFQSLELFGDLTVEENLAVACDDGRRVRLLTDLVAPARPRFSEAATAAVEQFGLRDSLHLRPSELSYGRRKLVAIARAMAAEPDVLLLDEPAAGLDDTEAHELGEVIVSLAKRWGMGVLMVEHNIDLVLRVCDTVSVLVGGSVIARGDPAAVASDPRVIEAYLGETVPTLEPT